MAAHASNKGAVGAAFRFYTTTLSVASAREKPRFETRQPQVAHTSTAVSPAGRGMRWDGAHRGAGRLGRRHKGQEERAEAAHRRTDAPRGACARLRQA
eukprot:226303-Prymnesium_polylepis.1